MRTLSPHDATQRPPATIEVRGLVKRFHTIDATITAADQINLDIEASAIVAVTGPSGSGKSTLLHLIGALDRPDEGTILIDGCDITRLNRRELADYRRSIGFVFQGSNLLPTLTVIDNVIVPTIPKRRHGADPRDRARQLLRDVGLSGREHTLATRLSGGQQQRVAIARALIGHPRLLLADEPTGNLDSTTGIEIVDLLLGLRDDHGTTILIATHDPDVANRCDRVIHVRDGRLSGA